jgi:predicted transcriptional regulator
MVAESTRGSVALLAIKPRFAEAIIAGRKTVEFRRTRFSLPPSHVVLYASTPVQQIVAYFEVAFIKELTPLGLWRQFRNSGAIEYPEFVEYYRDARTGIAIVVGNVWTLRAPVSLHRLDVRAKAPQSFRYLCTESIIRLADWT